MSIDRRRLRTYTGKQLVELKTILTSDVMKGFLADRRDYLVEQWVSRKGENELREKIDEIDDWGEKEVAAIEKLLEEKSG
jgi:hypothetical protein